MTKDIGWNGKWDSQPTQSNALREALERIEALQEALAQQVEACFCLDCEMCFRHEQLLKGTGQ
jgi:hypothetical protein